MRSKQDARMFEDSLQLGIQMHSKHQKFLTNTTVKCAEEVTVYIGCYLKFPTYAVYKILVTLLNTVV